MNYLEGESKSRGREGRKEGGREGRKEGILGKTIKFNYTNDNYLFHPLSDLLPCNVTLM